LIIAAFPEHVVGSTKPAVQAKNPDALHPESCALPLPTTSWNGRCSEGVLPIYPARLSALAMVYGCAADIIGGNATGDKNRVDAYCPARLARHS
jgi:hypothetical protein